MAQTISIAGKQVIITGKSAGHYLDARNIARKMRGKLISGVTHDTAIIGKHASKQIRSGYGCWNDEILAHPEKGSKFQKGIDIVDAQTGWTVPISEVLLLLKDDPFQTGAYLYITPEDVKPENGKTIVHPKSIIVLTGVVQRNASGGKVDEITRLPLQVDETIWKALNDEKKRWLYRIERVAVRPLIRGYSLGAGGSDFGRDVFAYCPPLSDGFGVLVEDATT